MSFRIDRTQGEDHIIVLSISGTIRREHVATLRNVLQQESGELAIDLKNVSLVDREAVQLLARSEDEGTELRNCPAYIREWVARERAEGKDQRTNEDIHDI